MEFSLYGTFSVYCQMEANGSWVILQRRTGPSLPFWNATFEEYANGFGDPHGDHWLGLERLFIFQHAFENNNKTLRMRVELIGDLCRSERSCSGKGDTGFWWGDWDFKIGDRASGFRIYDLAVADGNLSDTSYPEKDIFRQMSNHQPFTTVDRDNDNNKEGNCALQKKLGGWWHKDCTYSSLNGLYGSRHGRAQGQFWYYSTVTGGRENYNIKPRKTLIMFRALS